ncbi:alpha/beta hydrolase [Acaryochloris sp. IP29b_bin.137]|uniref:alpha/beta fold hydrolase n=1 Tax=Acaryochloris sp. IP29b_bin.137 TaxID=2969217 RepID=UPI00260D53C8|nr:alpha/beta hydrolase [Acaryochloris sp. IP29b_bin.137]
MPLQLQALLLAITTIYQIIACLLENRTSPPGQRIDIGGYALHLQTMGTGQQTIVLDHSLGGLEGYLLLNKLAPLGRVYIYDRAGYGWSDHSPYPRTSNQVVKELDLLLTHAKVEPPYLLVGDSFGSYNMRLYAHRFPKKVSGLVLTDGLHERAMLNMPFQLKALKLFFISGFLMSILGSAFGIIRLLRLCQVFMLVKPTLKKYPPVELTPVTRSFCRPKHWITMCRELWNLDQSGRQLRVAESLGTLPLASIKSQSFFKPSLLTRLAPLRSANRLRDKIHIDLMQLSAVSKQFPASHSSHFVWVDEPEVMVAAVEWVLANQPGA